jgi:tetratricopeptide (TPR) repeat protein
VLAYHAGAVEVSELRLQIAAQLLEQTGYANSLAVRVHTGLASHAVLRGDYQAALAHGTRAYSIADRIGDESRRVTLPSNIALYHARLGNIADQIAAAEQCLGALAHRFRGHPEIQASYFRCMGYALQGRNFEAASGLEQMQARLPVDVPRWTHQLWALFKADVLAVLGRRREAIKVARNVLEDVGGSGFEAPYRGLLARWTAMCVESQAEARAARAAILGLRFGKGALALLDKAEMACALTYVDNYMGVENQENAAEVRKLLSRLPAAISRDLVCIGCLPSP